jgi:DNA-binding NtrC family response regulator
VQRNQNQNRMLLVVDDEESVREALSRILGDEGYSVVTADGGEQALQLLQVKPIQLVITDQIMPGLSGLDLIKLIRVRHPRVLRIILTGDTDRDLPVRSINEGEVYRFIRKPFSNADLRTIVSLGFEVIRLEEEKRQLIALVRGQRAAWEEGKSPTDPLGLEAELLLLAEDESAGA